MPDTTAKPFTKHHDGKYTRHGTTIQYPTTPDESLYAFHMCLSLGNPALSSRGGKESCSQAVPAFPLYNKNVSVGTPARLSRHSPRKREKLSIPILIAFNGVAICT